MCGRWIALMAATSLIHTVSQCTPHGSCFVQWANSKLDTVEAWKNACPFPFLLLDSCYQHDNKPRLIYRRKSWALPGELVLNQLVLGNPSFGHRHPPEPLRTVNPAQVSRSTQLTSDLVRTISYCCFKPLNFEIVCFTILLWQWTTYIENA